MSSEALVNGSVGKIIEDTAEKGRCVFLFGKTEKDGTIIFAEKAAEIFESFKEAGLLSVGDRAGIGIVKRGGVNDFF